VKSLPEGHKVLGESSISQEDDVSCPAQGFRRLPLIRANRKTHSPPAPRICTGNRWEELVHWVALPLQTYGGKARAA